MGVSILPPGGLKGSIPESVSQISITALLTQNKQLPWEYFPLTLSWTETCFCQRHLAWKETNGPATDVETDTPERQSTSPSTPCRKLFLFYGRIYALFYSVWCTLKRYACLSEKHCRCMQHDCLPHFVFIFVPDDLKDSMDHMLYHCIHSATYTFFLYLSQTRYS